MSTVALLTDFGDQDGYTGVMKGVMLGICPEVRLVDIAHHIPAQDVHHAGWVLDHAYDAFPEGTVFLCVVDPGVGSPHQKKLALYIEQENKAIVMPDNGLASRILYRLNGTMRVVSLENADYFYTKGPVSQSFHGRDIYSPVAAHLAKAMAQGTVPTLFDALGPRLDPDSLVWRELPDPEVDWQAGVVYGLVDIADTYGNLITNIPHPWLNKGTYKVKLPEFCQLDSVPFVSCYQEQGEQQVVLIPGSHGMVEISVPKGSARQALGITATLPLSIQIAGALTQEKYAVGV